jgi:hypothetical protein
MGIICLLGFKGLFEEPDYDGEVTAFVVGREEDGVFVAGRHCEGWDWGCGCLELRSIGGGEGWCERVYG